MSIRWDSESDWKDNQDSSGATGRNGNLRQGYSRERPELSKDLVGYWPLHDDSATDYSGNSNHGNLNGGITTGVAGKAGLQAMSFDGNDDYVETDSVSHDFKTIAFWVKSNTAIDGSHSYRMPISSATDSGQYIAFGDTTSDVSGETISIISPENDKMTYINDTLAASEWHHLVFLWNGSNYDVYVDGTKRQTSSDIAGNAALWSSDSLNFMARAVSSDGFVTGKIADIRVYSQALTESEIQTLYEWGSKDYARPPNDGVAYYKLDGDATDDWGNNAGSVNGGLTWSNGIRGQSGDFNGTDAYIISSDGTSLNFGNNSFSISVWAKSRTNSNQQIIEKGAYSTNSGYRLSANEFVDFKVADGSNFLSAETSTSESHQDTWMHIVGVFNNSQNKAEVFINGSKKASATGSSIGDIDNSNDLHIGSVRGEGNFFDGLLDDIRLYERALRPEEIFELYRYGTRGRDMRKQLVNH